MTTRRSLAVPDGLDGLRLDVAVARLFGLSRTVAAGLVDAGDVLVDGRGAARSERVTGGAWLEVALPPPPAPPSAAPTAVPGLTVVFEDADLIVVDKPPGVAAHPSPGWDGPTVVGGLLGAGHRVATSGAAERQGIVHRLDVGTSGLMIVAKSEVAYRVLKDAFRARDVDKRYLALVQGYLDPLRGTIDAPIDRHPRQEHRFAVVSGGRPSVTHYDTLEAFPAASLLEIRLETGRTHQIRVHMAAVRHPCIGDITYGADPTLAARLDVTRQWLHAAVLELDHPTERRRLHFESEPAADLRPALERLRADR